jgi:hypothetical protein
MTSGQLPWIAGELKFKGKIGADLSPEQGFQAFRLSALNAIAQLKASLGSLDRVKQVVRLEGTRGCAPGFTAQPSVLNGASHVVNQIFGPRGRHTRMIYSNNEMPMNCARSIIYLASGVGRALSAAKPARNDRRPTRKPHVGTALRAFAHPTKLDAFERPKTRVWGGLVKQRRK